MQHNRRLHLQRAQESLDQRHMQIDQLLLEIPSRPDTTSDDPPLMLSPAPQLHRSHKAQAATATAAIRASNRS